MLQDLFYETAAKKSNEIRERNIDLDMLLDDSDDA